MSAPAQLSCQQCQRRKTKCDKTNPCSACSRAGIKCTAVQRHRLPRGRTAKQNAGNSQALQNRIEHLEAIVSQLQHEGPAMQPAPVSGSQPKTTGPSELVPVEDYVAPVFWTELSDAVAGIRDVLEDNELDSEIEAVQEESSASVPSSHSSPYAAVDTGSQAILFGGILASPSDDFNLPAETKEYLLQAYKYRVDPIFKPLHWPSTLAIIQPSDHILSTDARALELAMCFTASCSLFDHEFENRRVFVEQVRQAAERAFVRAGMLTTTSIVPLQAFIIYLAGLRASRSNAEQWTLTALAIRIASAQGLPDRLFDAKPSFDEEIRRRVWSCLGILDLQGAFDRGTRPLIHSKDLHAFPLNVNDAELSREHVPIEPEGNESKYTDMTHSLMIYRASICQRELTELGVSATSADGGGDAATISQKQVEVLSRFQQYTEKVNRLCDTTPIQAFTIVVADESLTAMRLLLHRPLYRRQPGFVPIGYGLSGDSEILRTATKVLEGSQVKRTQHQFAPWAWFAWVKWFALAIVLAELCTAHGPQADYSWKMAQICYDNYANLVADTKQGLLWKPIMKLMRKVKTLRESRAAQQLHNPTGASQTANSANVTTVVDPFGYTGVQAPMDLNLASFDASLAQFTDLGFSDADFIGTMDGIEDTSWLHWDQLIGDVHANYE